MHAPRVDEPDFPHHGLGGGFIPHSQPEDIVKHRQPRDEIFGDLSSAQDEATNSVILMFHEHFGVIGLIHVS